MFKLVVLSAIFAAVAAKPGALITTLGYTAPLTYSSVVAPGITTVSQQASSVVHPSPISYSAPLTFTHFIKKRSAPAFLTPTTYIANTHLAAAPLATTYTAPLAYHAPGLVHGAPILPAAPLPYVATHLIKKRSPGALIASAIPTTYAATQPLLTSAYTPLVHSTPLIHSVPLVSNPIITPHFIKKRSAPLLTTYLAPTAYSHQSRVDYTHSSPLISTTYSSPLTYSSPIALTHVL